jgi:hypothetical protein
MQTTILANEAFQYTASLRKLTSQPGAISFSICSVFAGARKPTEERTVFQATLGRDGLIALRDLIDREVR